MFNFLLILALAVLATAKITLQGLGLRKCVSGTFEADRFTALMLTATTAVLTAVLHPGIPSGTTFLYGIIFGICQATFQLSYAQSLRCGPVSLTVLIINLSLFISVAFGVIWERDILSIPQIIGIAALVVSMVLSMKKETNAKPVSKRWLFFVALGFFSNGLTFVLQRLHQLSPAASESSALLICGNGLAAVIAWLALLPELDKRRKEEPHVTPWGRLLLCIAGIGAILGVYQVLQIYVIGRMSLSLLSPLLSCTVSVMLFISGRTIFKDQLSSLQKMGFFIGVASILLMNL